MPDSTDQANAAYWQSLTWAELDRQLDQTERAREHKMTDQEWSAYVDKLDRQHETPQRSEWYRHTQAEHDIDLAAPQRFALTGDGLVTQRIVADGPFNGPDIGAELALARYRDHQHTEKLMPDRETQQQIDAYVKAWTTPSPTQEQQQRVLTLVNTENQQRAIEEERPQRSQRI
jgi:hypothetical protein